MYGYIYMTTNLINGKKYIGQHKADKFEGNKYIGSGAILERAIRKYGKDNFKVEILCECNSALELSIMEAFYIAKYDASNNKNFYNILPSDYSHNETSRRYISERIKNKRWVNNGVVNRYIEKDQLNDLLQQGWNSGKLPPDKQTRQRMSESAINRGNCLSEDGLRRCTKYGSDNGFYNHKHTSETKSHLSEVHKGRIWINNGVDNKHVKPEELDFYISQGYKEGMKERYDVDRKRIWIYNIDEQIRKMIYEDDLTTYIQQGYQVGYGNFKRSESSTTIEKH